MNKGLVVFIVIIVLIVAGIMGCSFMFAWLSQNREEVLTPAEKVIEDRYDSTYAGAIFSLKPDEWANGKVYEQHYKHGIYEAVFQANELTIDFGKVPAASLQATADSIYHDLLPVIPAIELYDSVRIRFMTRYKTRQRGEWPSADTFMHIAERRFVYSLR